MAIYTRLVRLMAALLVVAPSFVFALAAMQVQPCQMVCCQSEIDSRTTTESSCCSSEDKVVFTSDERDNCGCQIESSTVPNHGTFRFTATNVNSSVFDLGPVSDPVTLDSIEEQPITGAQIRLPNHDPPSPHLQEQDLGRAPPRLV